MKNSIKRLMQLQNQIETRMISIEAEVEGKRSTTDLDFTNITFSTMWQEDAMARARKIHEDLQDIDQSDKFFKSDETEDPTRAAFPNIRDKRNDNRRVDKTAEPIMMSVQCCNMKSVAIDEVEQQRRKYGNPMFIKKGQMF